MPKLHSKKAACKRNHQSYETQNTATCAGGRPAWPGALWRPSHWSHRESGRILWAQTFGSVKQYLSFSSSMARFFQVWWEEHRHLGPEFSRSPPLQTNKVTGKKSVLYSFLLTLLLALSGQWTVWYHVTLLSLSLHLLQIVRRRDCKSNVEPLDTRQGLKSYLCDQQD